MGNSSSVSPVSHQTIKTFDPVRYSGVWNEIAKYYLKWEADCQNAQAIYKWNPISQTMSVENQCYVGGKMIRSRRGQARIPNMADPGKLLLKFTDGLPADPGEAPYWIYYTDYEKYAIVGGPTGQYLWILARNPTIPIEDTVMLDKMVKSLGYDTTKLITNPGTIRPLK